MDISNSAITGGIPAELGNLPNLKYLYLRGNKLTGEIPAELGNLSNLRSLDLGSNELTGGIPVWLGAMLNLEHLSLSYNELSGEIPSELGSLANLRWLHLSGNELSGEIPPELGSLANLEVLSLSYNELSGEIPPELGSLANLRSLDLSDNQLSGEIPPELGSLANLQVLYLSDNQLSGEIPPELGSLANLRWLYLFDNQLSGEIPPELGSLANLRWLHLFDNQLSGEIPSELGSLANLRWLHLSGNELSGEISSELGSLANLRLLDLSDNQLSGEIPPEPGSLANLRWLYLSDNQLSGCIPEELRDVVDNDLEDLDLPFCDVLLSESPLGAPAISDVTPGTGSLTVAWSTPSQTGGSAITAYDLRYIRTDADETVESNWTVEQDAWTPGSGSLQYSLIGLTGGTQYDMQVRAVNAVGDGPWSATVTGTPATATTSSACATGGAVPDEPNNTGLVSDCEALLGLRDTFAGTATLNWSADTPISDWEGVLLEGSPLRVTELLLEWEGLPSGTLWGRVVPLGNQLSGEIPSELGSFANLEALDLRGNELSGEIPPELGSLTNLYFLNLSDNQLSGGIPSEIGSLSNLGLLDLHNNGLSGGIPPELGSLANLGWLSLRGNQLGGCIPEGLRDVASNDLEDLDLPFCDVLLSGLNIDPGTLTPPFDSYHTDYTTVVGQSRVTVTPANDHNASFQFLDEYNGEIVDADDSLVGHQVDLGAGVTTVRIRVISPDSRATHTYTIVDLVGRYDANDDGAIDRDEVLDAIDDYFDYDDRITKEEVLDLIDLYFSSAPTATPSPSQDATPTATCREAAAAHLAEIVPWFENPPSAAYADVPDVLIDLWLRDAELGDAVAVLPWVADRVGRMEKEAGVLRRLRNIADTDQQLAKQVVSYPWLAKDYLTPP